MAIYKNYLDQVDENLRKIDLFQVRVGTLHSLCNDIMQEYRYLEYQNNRLLDEMDQLLFVYEHSVLASSQPRQDLHLPLWQHFHLLTERYNQAAGYRWRRTDNYLPHRWIRTNATVQLFNRIVEDLISVSQMREEEGIWNTLGEAYESYRRNLETNQSCDFAHLQLKFLKFLKSSSSEHFLRGNRTPNHPGISHVLVDEYQDTNPIQEEIYLRLAHHPPHNLCVVGDDDQALYRFRGGTVDCMVNFNLSCQRTWGSQAQVTPIHLSTNYRSHPEIVGWCDNYIQSFDILTEPGARVADKPNLSPDPQWSVSRASQGAQIENYPTVSYLVGQSKRDVANQFAELVRGLLNNRIVSDPSQCVLLLKTTRISSSGPYQDALEHRGIQVYNPRGRTFLEQPEIQTAMGALATILDPDQTILCRVRTRGVKSTIQSWIQTYTEQASTNSTLSDYVNQAINRIRQIPAGQIVTQSTTQSTTTINATIQEIFYHMISLEPFASWQEQTDCTVRLGKLSKVLESYSMLPFLGSVGSTRGVLQTDRQNAGQIRSEQINHLYHSLIGMLVSEGLNDPEDEEVICPQGFFPIMTVHQAKGLEFPFVFVTELGTQNVRIGAELQIEDAMRPFRTNPLPVTFDAHERAEQDYIRLFYVAYSRAEYSLVLLTRAKELRDQGLGFGGYGREWFSRQTQQLG